ncbi:hypothetical protein ACAW74_17015 [Fibrella sp. WM1]|uniref:DUF6970 domain-containing protein n=1 Tax=Fibrella musci TaxID=3242485 RepID=UPI003521E335
MMKRYVLLVGLAALLACSRSTEPAPTDVPACIRTIIQQNGQFEKTNLHFVSIRRYLYQNRYVYFALSDCCDMYDILFDTTCQRICSPSGGFSGGGDGQCPNFFKEATGETLIWQRPQ